MTTSEQLLACLLEIFGDTHSDAFGNWIIPRVQTASIARLLELIHELEKE